MAIEKPDKDKDKDKDKDEKAKKGQGIKKGEPPQRKKISPGTYQDEKGRIIKTGQGDEAQGNDDKRS